MAARRWGPEAGGWLAALPLTSGPATLVIAVEHGASFAATACVGIELAVVSLVLYVLVYAWASERVGWAVSATLACGAYVTCTLVLSHARLSLGMSAVCGFSAIAVGGRLLPADRPSISPTVPPGWDVPVRVIVAFVVVWSLAQIASIAGPNLSGLLTPFPIAITIMATFTHRHEGSAAARCLLRGLLTGLASFLVFFLIVGALLSRLGISRAFVVATCGALLTHMGIWIARRGTGQQPSFSLAGVQPPAFSTETHTRRARR